LETAILPGYQAWIASGGCLIFAYPTHILIMSIEILTLRDEIKQGDPLIVREIGASTGFFYEDEVDVTERLASDCLMKDKACGYHFIFADTEDGRTAGYCCFGKIPCTRSSFSIYWIAVHSEYKRKGIGKMLIAAAEERVLAMGGTTVYLDTASRALYEPTRKFYLCCRYVAEAQLKDYYAIGDDKIVFVKRF
jgi:D-alanine-D-alanine ligase